MLSQNCDLIIFSVSYLSIFLIELRHTCVDGQMELTCVDGPTFIKKRVQI